MSSLRDILQGIYDQRGTLTPQIVLDEARDPSHPLHHRFEWNDAVAAEKYRREQAHELIKSVKISYANPEGKQSEIRAFHAVRRPAGHVYEPVEEIVRDEIATKILLADMEREWRQMKKRYEGFKEFWALVKSEVDAA